jgi:phage-related protein
MVNETEVIREKMEETRTNLSEKLEQLESKVVDSVQNATSAVADTVQNATDTVNEAMQSAKDVVESVKDSVQGTVDSVKDTMDSVKGSVEGTVDSVRESFSNAAEGVRDAFDLPKQMDRHPWLMLGGAVAVGFIAGKMMGSAPRVGRMAYQAAGTAASTVGTTAAAVGSAASATGSMLGALENMFGPEINKVKELALGALLGVVRDMAVQAAPETMAPQVREIIDGFTSKVGGKPFEGEVLGPRPEEEAVGNGPKRRF